MNQFIKGMELSKKFFHEEVKGILESEFLDLDYTAGLLGYGSEVLGFDTEQSTDHHWGPRVILFLKEQDFVLKDEISKVLSEMLPKEFYGYSTHFGEPDDGGVQLLSEPKEGEPINHRVEIYTVDSFFSDYLGVDIKKELEFLDWLVLSEQKLRTIVSGKLFHDGIGVDEVLKRFEYYPRDVWLYILASEWQAFHEEECFVGRCGDVGDETGSRIVAARIVQAIMTLCFLMEKQYAPYSKWFGTAFKELKCAGEMRPILDKILEAEDWKERQMYITKAGEQLADMHNDLRITKKMATKVRSFFGRPYNVIFGCDFAEAIREKIENEKVLKWKPNLGSVNQLTDSVMALEDNEVLGRMKGVWKD